MQTQPIYETPHQVAVQRNGAVETLARSIAGQPGNEDRKYRDLQVSAKREFANFAYSEMTKFEKTGWFSDSLCGLEMSMLDLLKGKTPTVDTVNALGQMLCDAYLSSIESLYDTPVEELGPLDGNGWTA